MVQPRLRPTAGGRRGGDNGLKSRQRGGKRRRPGCRTPPRPAGDRNAAAPHLPTQRRHSAEAALPGPVASALPRPSLPPSPSQAQARARQFRPALLHLRPAACTVGSRTAASLLRAHSARISAFRSSRLAEQMNSPFPTRSLSVRENCNLGSHRPPPWSRSNLPGESSLRQRMGGLSKMESSQVTLFKIRCGICIQ